MRRALRRIWLACAPLAFARFAQPSTEELGRLGEELAARALRRAGWRVLARRLRTPWAEVDLVAVDGAELVCVEVKAARLPAVPRPNGRALPRIEWRWAPGARVDRERLRRLAGAARWLEDRSGTARPRAGAGGRVDVIEVVLRGHPPALELRHHRRCERPPVPP